MSYPNYPGYPSYPGAPAPQQQSGYPYPSQTAYPGYPPQQASYPGQQTGYPGQQASYPGQQAGYPGQQTGYPGYPAPAYGQYPPAPAAPAVQSYPSAPGYAPAPQPYPPAPGGYAPASAPVGTPYSAPYAAPTHQAVEQYVPTVHPHQPFDARADADALHKAMKGLGTNEKGLINVLCRRTCVQRVQITQAYKAGYGKDLDSKIKSETSGNFEKLLVALTRSRAELLARELREAVDGLGTKEGTLIEILCSGTNQEIRDINDCYVRLYGRPLEKDVKGDTSGTFKMLLVSLAQGQRDENVVVDQQKVKDDAQRLYQAGAAKLGTDESTFNSILATRSWPHLRQLVHEYRAMTGRSLEQDVEREFSANAEKGLLGILQCAQNRPAYFAKRLNGALRGAGTRDGTLIRLIVTRCDVDLGSVKIEYEKMFGKRLQADVAGDTSGDYKQALLTLIG